MTIKNIIYETDNYIVDTPERPFVDRLEGGHIRISPKIKVSDRTKLSPEFAIEYIKLSMIVGEALTTGLQKNGIDIGIVNYQDMGNWAVFDPEGPTMHMHIFGRAKTATKQKYGDAVLLPKRDTGFYDGFKPLNEDEMNAISEEVEKLLQTEKYDKFVTH
jgi:diadenosine tetraphosphate (Ap4A) HIT family hydrolase